MPTLLSHIAALELLFNSTKGDQWRWKNEAVNGPKWSFTDPQVDPCNDKNRVWQGLTCSSLPDICKLQPCGIESLVLKSYDLKGTLPSQFFVQLTSLTNLEISESLGLVGSIPSELVLLSQLSSLSLYSNQLTGPLPSELAFLSQLGTLTLSSNLLTGSIFSELGLLSQLSSLSLDSNQLTGSIPSQFSLLSQLDTLTLSNNQLTGSISPEMGLLTQLSYFPLYNNQLTGPIPSQLSLLSQLGSLTLYKNQLTGPIPTELGLLTQLSYLSLSINQLTGTIPTELAFLTRLGSLYLSTNLLTGTIPSELGLLSELRDLPLDNNQLSGSIPSELSLLSRLGYFALSVNRLTGTIPSELGSLYRLSSFYLDNTLLTGTIPSSISSLVNLAFLHLYHNHLTGSLTFQLTSFPYLEQLFLHRNQFTGHLHPLFSSSSASSSASSSQLFNLDLSDNLFSGSIPSTLFLPHLASISLSLNCFEHELTSSICQAAGADVISMDGLGSAKGCKNVVTLPFTSVSLVRSMEGSIPDCVWLLSNLTMLSLAGNGLRGRIRSDASMRSLLSLTLSHNHLSGKIPLWLQQKKMNHLDLSHNKLTGNVDDFKHQDDSLANQSFSSLSSNRDLALSVNRLSGYLPNSFVEYADLDILSGNLFGCENLPKNDENSESISCGSEQYDQTLTLMGGVLGLMVCLLGVYSLVRILSRNTEAKNDRMALFSRRIDSGFFLRYARYHLHPFFRSNPHPTGKVPSPSQPHSLQHQSTISFGFLLSRLMQSTCLLAFLCLLLSLPIYVLKKLDVESSGDEGETQYVTHSHMYNWLWTIAFVSGTTPAIIFLVMGFVSLSYFTYVVNCLAAVNEEPASALHLPKSTKEQSHFPLFIVWIIFILNIGVVGTVNGLYLWSTLIDISSSVRIWVQFSFGLFSFLWSVVLRLGLPSEIKESRYGVWLFICLNVINNVMIPCLVTALSSPSCYQRLLIPPDDISSSYSFQSCSFMIFLSDGSSKCLRYGHALMDALKITPPFFYSYQCGSTLLTSYIPVHMYSISLRLISTIVNFITVISSSSIVDQYPHWLLFLFPGVCWPSH
jgi:Leucine-rich repeat (LRR) protein